VGLVKEACVPGVLTTGASEEGITAEMREMCSSEGKDLLTLHGQGTDVLADTSYKIGNCSILFQKTA
jgi:hypothetical protein